MPPKPQTDLVREHGEHLASLGQRLDHLQLDVARTEASVLETKKSIQDLDKQVALIIRDLDRFEKRLDELLTRRWEIWKLVVAAIIGAVLSGGVGIATKWIERNHQIEPIREKR